MVAWAGSASRREVRAAAPRLREIPLALRAQQEARHARAEAGAAAGQLPLSVRAAAPLWALAAERSTRAEAALLLPLARLALSHLHAEHGEHAEHGGEHGGALDAPAGLVAARAWLAEAAADLAEEIVERTARSPLDGATAQTLAWRLEGAAAGGGGGGGGGGAGAAAEGAWLAGALCTLSVTWQRRTWLDGAAEAAPTLPLTLSLALTRRL